LLSEWLALVQSRENSAVRSFLSGELSKPLALFCERYEEIARELGIGRLRAQIWVSLVEENIEKWAGALLPVLVDLDEQFRKLQSREGEFAAMAESLRPSARRGLAAMIRRMNELRCLSLYERWRVMLDAMETVRCLNECERVPESIYPLVVLAHDSECFMSTFIVLNNFAMRLKPFWKLCSTMERLLWLKLESSILIALNRDGVVLQGMISLQDTFAQLAEDHIR
jgi:hypothetical protein